MMSPMRPQVFRTILAAVVALLVAQPATAQLFRAYLASDGNDANPCTLPQPCRLLPAAIAAVASGGEIWMLDSANYNVATVNVTKSVTILAIPGAVGSVVAVGGPAISIATPGVEVSLRNLVIVPVAGGGGTTGITLSAGSGLFVEHCLIAGLPDSGMSVTTAASVRVVDTTVRNNGVHGITLSGGAEAVITRAIVSRNGQDGVRVRGNVAATSTAAHIADSTIDGNGITAVYGQSTNATAAIWMSIRGSRLVRNSYGAWAQSTAGALVALTASDNIVTQSTNSALIAGGVGARAWASGNMVSDNNFGLVQQDGALFESAGNNSVRNHGPANSQNKFGTINVITQE